MDEQNELLLTVVKGLIGSAANLALPGLGAMVSVGFALIKGKSGKGDPGEEMAKELLASFMTVAPRKKVPGRVRLRNARSRREKKEARRLVGAGVQLNDLMEIAARTAEQTGAVDITKLSEAEQNDWAALGRAQLAMVSSPSFVPGVWQDEFAALLQTVCERELDGGEDRDCWRLLLGIEDEQEDDPAGARLNQQLRTVTRVFAARIDANPTLTTLAKELRRADRSAMQYALLWRMDQQRQSLQLIAAALCALLVALGVEVEILQ